MVSSFGEMMTLPDINFEKIRQYDGSCHAGFEELCSQLASLEAPVDSKFFRKGRGADAGVECYLQRPDESEVGWQAKYVFEWDGLPSQLDDSIGTALKKHPKLNEYVVCIPFDLPDARRGKGKTAREKWEAWCKKWIDEAVAQGRGLKITLWGKSELAGRLANDSAFYGGRLLYWFGIDAFTSDWFLNQFEKTKAALGARYTPESNVELPIRRNFLAFARDKELQKQLDRWFLRVSEDGRSAVDNIRRVDPICNDPHSEKLAKAVYDITGFLGEWPIGPEAQYPLDRYVYSAEQCRAIASEAISWVYKLLQSKSNNDDPVQWARHSLYKLLSTLDDITADMISINWQITKASAVLLKGPAGIGKSHLLADVVESQVQAGRPALLILGSTFTDAEPWRQILNQLDRPFSEQVKHFLGCMDSAAQAVGVKALICIDAVNERNGMDVWPHRLAAFLKMVEPFPRIGVVLSCRSTYIPYIIPDGLGRGASPGNRRQARKARTGRRQRPD